MKVNLNGGGLKGLPLAFVVSLLFQGGVAVWWVSAKARDTYFLEQRVSHIESVLLKSGDSATAVHERLARIEERLNAQMVLLSRIDKQFSGSR